MTTTNIQFDEKQEFETIKTLIEANFKNFKIQKIKSDINYISFDFKGENIYCSFMKDNKIYGENNEITECSSFSSDRPNKNKTEAFRIIAKCFNCKMWENDCNEDKFEIFTTKKLPSPVLTPNSERVIVSKRTYSVEYNEYSDGRTSIKRENNGFKSTELLAELLLAQYEVIQDIQSTKE